jgi:hypothetical protein
MIRVGYRGYGTGSLAEDDMYVQNIQGAVNAGLKVGVYIFSQAITQEEAVAEANYVLARIKSYHIQLPVVIDYEYASGNTGRLYDAHLSKDAATAVVTSFCQTVAAAGYVPMIYANKNMLENSLNGTTLDDTYLIWLANYTTETSYAGEYYAWQYSSAGQVSGVTNRVDCDFFYEMDLQQSAEQYVTRLYQYLLGRTPDNAGLRNYANALAQGSATASSVAATLISSTEFTNRKLSDSAYVANLYLALLGRSGSQSEINNWTTYLQNGVSKQYILKQVAGSAEFAKVCHKYGIAQGNITLTENRDKNYNITSYVMRCYQKVLDRNADVTGLNTWTGKLLAGSSGAEIVKDLVVSREFKNKKLSNAEFVERMYQAMLGRASDASGKKNWLDTMSKGVSEIYIINGFAGSNEFGNLCRNYGIIAGKAAVTEARDQNINVTAFVQRNYQYALGRQGESSGLNNWCQQILSKKQSPKQVAYGFVFSKEAIGKNLSNADYVEMLYRLCLNRASDASGKNDWVRQLNAGVSREKVFWGFANSKEFEKIISGYGL